MRVKRDLFNRFNDGFDLAAVFSIFIFRISGKEAERRINPSSVISTTTTPVMGLNDSISRYAMARVGRPVESQPSCMNSIKSEKEFVVLGFGAV